MIEAKLQNPGLADLDITEENMRLKGVFAEIIDGLESLRSVLPEDVMSSLDRQIRLLLRQQVDREPARVEGFEFQP
jgi:hypothetical protein